MEVDNGHPKERILFLYKQWVFQRVQCHISCPAFNACPRHRSQDTHSMHASCSLCKLGLHDLGVLWVQHGPIVTLGIPLSTDLNCNPHSGPRRAPCPNEHWTFRPPGPACSCQLDAELPNQHQAQWHQAQPEPGCALEHAWKWRGEAESWHYCQESRRGGV